nr:Chain C, PHE-ALA-LYS-LYS-LYS-TYR-CYS-LEU [Human immunodeficiency virus 1]
FAKKKYCL